jgi:hypothetical protein
MICYELRQDHVKFTSLQQDEPRYASVFIILQMSGATLLVQRIGTNCFLHVFCFEDMTKHETANRSNQSTNLDRKFTLARTNELCKHLHLENDQCSKRPKPFVA